MNAPITVLAPSDSFVREEVKGKSLAYFQLREEENAPDDTKQGHRPKDPTDMDPHRREQIGCHECHEERGRYVACRAEGLGSCQNHSVE